VHPEERIKIAPSILSADFSRLGEQVTEASCGGADYIHIDIMDGIFVPNLTFGPQVVKAIRSCTNTPLDVHMMVSEPERFTAQVAEAGADIITVHAEATTGLQKTVRQVRDTGTKVGVAINPDTPASMVEDVLPYIDLVLVMTVNPGLAGQQFICDMDKKISEVRTMLDRSGNSVELEVDGGINPNTAITAVGAGASVLVAGSAVYSSEISVANAIARIRESLRS